MNLYHLSYLQQASELLEDEHKPVAAKLGYIAKKVAARFTIHTQGADPPKLRRCKACQAPITSGDLRVADKRLVARCSLCGFKRHFSLGSKQVEASSDY